MSSRILMTASALFLMMCGFVTLFAPEEVLGVHGTEPDAATALLVQMMGALYLGFAILNWRARGINTASADALSVAAGNFVHFLVVAIVLGKAAIDHRVLPLAVSTMVFGAFAFGFGLWLFAGNMGRPTGEAKG